MKSTKKTASAKVPAKATEVASATKAIKAVVSRVLAFIDAFGALQGQVFAQSGTPLVDCVQGNKWVKSYTVALLATQLAESEAMRMQLWHESLNLTGVLMGGQFGGMVKGATTENNKQERVARKAPCNEYAQNPKHGWVVVPHRSTAKKRVEDLGKAACQLATPQGALLAQAFLERNDKPATVKAVKELVAGAIAYAGKRIA